MKTVAIDRAEYFSLEIDETATPARFFVTIPVSNRMCDYTEMYEIDEPTFEQYCRDLKSALPFVQQCRERLHDDLLLLKPGTDRGEPWWPASSK